jgi:nephrocystin-3
MAECRAFAPELIDRYPWLKGHEGASVSELEFLYGALNDTGAACRAFFYFRSQKYLDQLLPEERVRYRESPLDEEGGRWEAARIRSRKLARLKRRIRMSGLPLRDQYPDLHVLGELVYQDLERAIREDFPEQIPEDPLTRDRRNHEGYARTRNRIHLPRPHDYKRLDTHANAKGPPLVVLGPSGIGKSALLANWAGRYRSARPERPLVEYYVGASTESTDWRQLVVGVLGQLGVPVPKSATNAEALRVAFAGGLQRVAASGGCVLILDAINQLDDREGALDLAWLPPSLPQNVRVIVATLEGRALLECRRRRWAEMSIRQLRRGERRRLIALYLERMYSKRLSAGQVERIARPPLAANPLWLIVVLEELRLYGEHETLDRQIEFYLGARSIEELFELVLRRWETDYERERPALVRDAMRALWAARQGLSESEIRELLGGPEGPLPALVWAIFQFAADHSLVSRSGLIGFFHTYLRRAVERQYLQNDDERRAAHVRLAAYFQNREPSPRRIQELPWQLARGEAWDHLYNLLCEYEFF